MAHVVSQTSTVVAFDLDGTLLRGDSFVPFLTKLAGATGVALALAEETAHHRGRRDAIKHGVVQRILGGRSVADVSHTAEAFAASVTSSPIWVRRDVLELAQSLREHDRQVGIVTASPQIYGRDFAASFGLDFCLGTRLAEEAGLFTGDIKGANCRGEEKVRRIEEAFPEATLIAAFGDSDGDRAMAERATLGVRVSRWWKGPTVWQRWS